MNVRNLPAHAQSRLVVSPDDRRVATPFRSTDVTTALTRGIAEYVASLPPISVDGRHLSFVGVFDAWAEPEDESRDYPRFAAYTNDTEGAYDAQNFTPEVTPSVRYADGTYEVSSSSLDIVITCGVWATDTEMRKAMVLQLEEAFEPLEWMAGFRLELPHYFNQRATYLPLSTTYLGGSGEAIARFVNARLLVKASVPRTRVLPFAQFQRLKTIVNASNIPPPVAAAGVDVSGEV